MRFSIFELCLFFIFIATAIAVLHENTAVFNWIYLVTLVCSILFFFVYSLWRTRSKTAFWTFFIASGAAYGCFAFSTDQEGYFPRQAGSDWSTIAMYHTYHAMGHKLPWHILKKYTSFEQSLIVEQKGRTEQSALEKARSIFGADLDPWSEPDPFIEQADADLTDWVKGEETDNEPEQAAKDSKTKNVNVPSLPYDLKGSGIDFAELNRKYFQRFSIIWHSSVAILLGWIFGHVAVLVATVLPINLSLSRASTS